MKGMKFIMNYRAPEIQYNLLDIDVISYNKNGNPPKPLKFRVEIEDQVKVGKVLQIRDVIKEGYMGNRMYLYRCEVLYDGSTTFMELKYERDTMKWFMYIPGTRQGKIGE